MQEGTELAAPDFTAVEPVGDAAREILGPKADKIHEGGMTQDGFNEAEGGSKQDDLVNKITWAQGWASNSSWPLHVQVWLANNHGRGPMGLGESPDRGFYSHPNTRRTDRNR